MQLRRVGYLVIDAGILLLASGVPINPYFHNMSSNTITTTRSHHQITCYDNRFYVTITPSNMTANVTNWNIAVNPNSD